MMCVSDLWRMSEFLILPVWRDMLAWVQTLAASGKCSPVRQKLKANWVVRCSHRVV